MSWRRLLGALVVAALVAAAVAGLLRSSAPARDADPVRTVTQGLRCPACQGESVADSQSPIAAAMREAVAEQLAQGRSPAEIRRWFVERYGDDVLADPPARGLSLLLWAVPALALLGAGAAAVRTLRPSRHRRPVAAAAGRARGGTAAQRVWWVSCAGVMVLVAAVALAADRLDDAQPQGRPADPVAVTLQLARDLERDQRYDAAAELYREALRDRPDDGVQLRLAFALLRAGDAAGAERTVREVLARSPDSPDGLLVLGLAQRSTRPGDAPETLRRFLAVAPRHPAAPEIRRLLGA
ncbi:cytochrome c-type biogenesis protein CcmH [Micromonospora avicenniae]|uniref:Cytochrome c-type biogenesis protein n=1 Tax=Micromonospora avicenniae TaxID=1198245 RepID=A0A1N7BIE7_9ACTN|nr:cytochrome c-type biogenesis protein CcmH [Micromonospora avicenniae]SIR51169.1 Cytochrome c-type biogenesis protein CcmH/NrfF [Micromonospora avicenniae]